MRYLKHIARMFVFLLFAGGSVCAQKAALISPDARTFDFGAIAEAEGLATHRFVIQNTGTQPLVINRITASCGCARPEWTKAPIEPGDSGEVQVSYNPKGRPGPFYKSIAIHSNAKNGKLTLYIKGTVMSRAPEPLISYPYSIGNLKLQTKIIEYSRIHPGEIREEAIRIKNEGDTPLTVHFDKEPDYLTIALSPDTLKAGETGEISILFHTNEVKKMGRVSAWLPLSVGNVPEKKRTEGSVRIAANIIDDFSRLSASDKAQAPVARFSQTVLDFGKLSGKSGHIIPFIGSGKESESLTITNTGQSPLVIYSITCDHELVSVPGGKKELKPGASFSCKVSLHPKELKTKLETFIHVLSNDPNGPVRLIRITAEK